MKKEGFWWQALSEGKQPSSKRVAGLFLVLVIGVVETMLAVQFGCCDVVENLGQTIIICAAALLGVSCIASRFGGGGAQAGNCKKEENDNEES